ncbi:MAG: cbb3-type cytochrome oxidase assembly protein CcoS [Rhodospirillales bacterium]|nr:cbb3-type cytochrome oxidase assembly protein CcoS [Rhodospirillales bacterium]
MNTLLILIPASLGIGLVALAAFMWALRSGQFDDLDGAANRILFDDDEHSSRKQEAAPSDDPPKTKESSGR